MENYQNLNDLVSRNDRAKQYFVELPDYVRGMAISRTDSIKSYSGLYEFAEGVRRDIVQ